MKQVTKNILGGIQKCGLDKPLISLLNNRLCNGLMLKYCWHERDFASYREQYEMWQKKMKDLGIALAGKSVLDIGSGNSIGLGYFFLREGFSLWTATDLHKHLDDDPRAVKREERLVAEVARKFDGSVLKEAAFKNGAVSWGQELGFLVLDATHYEPKLAGLYDLIITSAVMEHIPRDKAKQTIENMAKYLRPGGMMIHDIDMRDHVNVANPFRFFRYSGAEWDRLTLGTIFYTNRLRQSDFLSYFESAGLFISHLEPTTAPLPKGLPIAEDFSGYSKKDLEVTRIFVILGKK